ncbi:MAG: DUF434 domain-containing protein [Syntrophobacteraceae bacterium]
MTFPLRRGFPAEAAADFFAFQNRGYPRTRALEWVGDRYCLTRTERDALNRGVFGQAEALGRRSRMCLGASWRSGLLAVDGHNVHITMESAILGRAIVRANDGALRDLAGLSARFRMTEASLTAVDAICGFLRKYPPREVLFLFDAPMSHSGNLASAYSERLCSLGLAGDARAVPVPEREFPYSVCTVAGSDRAVLGASVRWIDLAGWILDEAGVFVPALDFSRFILSADGRPEEASCPEGP